MDPTRLPVNLSTHLDKASGEAWTSGVYRDSPCGCTVVGNGTSPHPLRVQHCAMHAAQGMPAAEQSTSISARAEGGPA